MVSSPCKAVLPQRQSRQGFQSQGTHLSIANTKRRGSAVAGLLFLLFLRKKEDADSTHGVPCRTVPSLSRRFTQTSRDSVGDGALDVPRICRNLTASHVLWGRKRYAFSNYSFCPTRTAHKRTSVGPLVNHPHREGQGRFASISPLDSPLFSRRVRR